MVAGGGLTRKDMEEEAEVMQISYSQLIKCVVICQSSKRKLIHMEMAKNEFMEVTRTGSYEPLQKDTSKNNDCQKLQLTLQGADGGESDLIVVSEMMERFKH